MQKRGAPERFWVSHGCPGPKRCENQTPPARKQTRPTRTPGTLRNWQGVVLKTFKPSFRSRRCTAGYPYHQAAKLSGHPNSTAASSPCLRRATGALQRAKAKARLTMGVARATLSSKLTPGHSRTSYCYKGMPRSNSR